MAGGDPRAPNWYRVWDAEGSLWGSLAAGIRGSVPHSPLKHSSAATPGSSPSERWAPLPGDHRQPRPPPLMSKFRKLKGLRKMRQRDRYKSEASLDYTARPWLRKGNKG